MRKTEGATDRTCRTTCLARQHLFPETYGITREDVVKVVNDIGGLLWGLVVFNSHYIELWSRFRSFQRDWLDHLLYDKRALVEMHVLRVGLRIVSSIDAPYYFQATRSVVKRAGWRFIDPSEMKQVHRNIVGIFEKHGKLSFTSLKKRYYADFGQMVPRWAFEELCHSGIVLRVGRNGIAPFFGLKSQFYPDIDFYNVQETEAKEWVALKCLEAYGPLGNRDVAHWTGWTIKEAAETLEALRQKGKIIECAVESRNDMHWIREEDADALEDFAQRNYRDFAQILSYEDELMNGYSLRLASSFGYPWRGGHRQHLPVLDNSEDYGPRIIGDIQLKHEGKTGKLVVKHIYLEKASDNACVRKILEEKLAAFASLFSTESQFEKSDLYVLY